MSSSAPEKFGEKAFQRAYDESASASQSSSLSRHSAQTDILQIYTVSEGSLVAQGMAYLNRGARHLEGARDTAKKLRAEYSKAAKRHRNVKIAALTAETLLMAYYGYGAIEHYTGNKTGTAAILTNGAISGGISVTRAAVQYGLMKRGEEAFREGDKARGMLFTGIGITLAMINSLFVAVGFADKYVAQEQGVAGQELNKLSAQEAEVYERKAVESERINKEINALDNKLAQIRSADSDPRILAISEQMTRLGQEIDGIRNHPNFNDGRETEWDKTARVDMDRKSALVEDLARQKEDLLKNMGSNLTAEQKKMIEATTQQRLALNDELNKLDERYQPQIDALKTSRVLWEAKLGVVSETSGSSFSAIQGNPTILIEALANVAAISVANWWAATEGYKQEKIEDILSGAPQDPWAGKTARTNISAFGEQSDISSDGKIFMGYDCSVSALDHLRNEEQINALAKALGNPDAMLTELKSEIVRLHGRIVMALHNNKEKFSEHEYKERLDGINQAYEAALKTLAGEDIINEIRLIMEEGPGQITLSETEKMPVIKSPDDKRLKKLQSGTPFRTPDGQVRIKR